MLGENLKSSILILYYDKDFRQNRRKIRWQNHLSSDHLFYNGTCDCNYVFLSLRFLKNVFYKLYLFGLPFMNLSIKGSKLYGILKLKCPRCHEGDLFSDKNPYHFKNLDKMPHYCPACGENLQREIGFYYGAMMISHATTTLIAVLVHVIVFHFYGWEIVPNVIPIISILIIFFPVIFRISRAIWISMFSKYDPNAIKNKLIHKKALPDH